MTHEREVSVDTGDGTMSTIHITINVGGDKHHQSVLAAIGKLRREVMGQIQDLTAAQQEETTALNEALGRIDEDVNALEQQIADLSADRPEVTELIANIKANTEKLKSVDPVPSSVIVPPAPVEPGTPDTPAEPTPDVPAEPTPDVPVEDGGDTPAPVEG